MSQATNYLEGKLLEHLFDLASYSAPATMYLGLFTSVTDGEVPTLTEVSGGSYARAAITNDATSWSRTGNVVSNDNLITFTTATGSQGTVTHWGLWDASSGGNLLVYGTLPAATAINNGTTFRVAAGQIVVTYNAKSNYTAGKLLDHLCGIASWTVPTDHYIAAMTANPTDAGGGTEVSTSGTDYDRIQVAVGSAEWTRTNNEVSNDNDVLWDPATASYGSVTGHAAYDANPAGNLLWWAPRASPTTIGIGSELALLAGEIVYKLD
jgi:hypothetical protein